MVAPLESFVEDWRYLNEIVRNYLIVTFTKRDRIEQDRNPMHRHFLQFVISVPQDHLQEFVVLNSHLMIRLDYVYKFGALTTFKQSAFFIFLYTSVHQLLDHAFVDHAGFGPGEQQMGNAC